MHLFMNGIYEKGAVRSAVAGYNIERSREKGTEEGNFNGVTSSSQREMSIH